MLSSIPAEIWNGIAETETLRTAWAKKHFPLTEQEMEQAEEKEADALEKNWPRAVVRGFQDMRPLLLEREALRQWTRKHPEHAAALPEVNSLEEAVDMAAMDWMYDETEKRQLRELLREAMTA